VIKFRKVNMALETRVLVTMSRHKSSLERLVACTTLSSGATSINSFFYFYFLCECAYNDMLGSYVSFFVFHSLN